MCPLRAILPGFTLLGTVHFQISKTSAHDGAKAKVGTDKDHLLGSITVIPSLDVGPGGSLGSHDFSACSRPSEDWTALSVGQSESGCEIFVDDANSAGPMLAMGSSYDGPYSNPITWQ